jgi:hypothetical protein
MTSDNARLRRPRRELAKVLHHPRGPDFDVMLVLRDCWIAACVATRRDRGISYEQAISDVTRKWPILALLGPPLVRSQAEHRLSAATVRRAYETFNGLYDQAPGLPDTMTSEVARGSRRPRFVDRDKDLGFLVAVLCAMGAGYKDAIGWVTREWSEISVKFKLPKVSKATVRRAYAKLPLNRRPGRGRRRHPAGTRVIKLPPSNWKPPYDG